jgi:hypothetical protein
MKHEKFKVFKVLHNDMSEVITFLKDAPITPKSLSISHIEGTEDALLSIGYENESSKHDFQLVTYKIVDGVKADTKNIEQALDGYAEETNGVICQDIVSFGEDIIVTFLTTK